MLEDKKYIDSVKLIRKAISECAPIDAEFIVLEEFPLNPLATALLNKVSNGTFEQVSIKSLYKVSDDPLKISSFKNCYGASNEVETILADIYSDKKLDKCSVAVTDPGTYGQLFFDYALIYDIPITFGCGVPIINSNPAKLLSLYYQWTTTGFFGADALKKMLFNKVFNRSKLMELFPEQDENFRWSRFYQYLGDICFTNVKKDNLAKMAAFAKAVEAEAKYMVEGESKEYREYVYNTVIGQDIVIVVVADEIVLAVFCYHLIRVDYVIFGLAVFFELRVVLFISTVVDIMERYLALTLDSLIQNLDRVEELFVINFSIRKSLNVFYIRLEVLAGKSFEFFNEFLTAFVGNMV